MSAYLFLNAIDASCQDGQRMRLKGFKVTVVLSGVINSLRSTHRFIQGPKK